MDLVEEVVVANVVHVDWLELPEHLTYHILSKLTCISDYARFGAVCVQWRNIVLAAYEDNYKNSLLPPQLPLLMIPTLLENIKKKKKRKKIKKKSGTSFSCSFYRVTDGKIYDRLQLTLPRDRYVRGAGHGWLITVDQDEIYERDFSVRLMNPFFYPNTATKEIKLPPLTAHPNEQEQHDPVQHDPVFASYHKYDPVFSCLHLRRAVLSADPILNPKDFMVMSIFGGFTTLAFCKPGDKAWTPIIDNVKGLFEDVIYYKGEFYALHYLGTVVVCNVAKRTTSTFAKPPVTQISFDDKKYLIVSAGKLYQVHRQVDNNSDTQGFKVFKLQCREPATEWVEVKDLCDHVFFVGDNTSMSISASDFPGCKPNSIYYTDNNSKYYLSYENCGPHDLGVFNLENGSFEQHYPTNTKAQLWPAPIWIEPTLPRSITRYIKKPIK